MATTELVRGAAHATAAAAAALLAAVGVIAADVPASVVSASTVIHLASSPATQW